MPLAWFGEVVVRIVQDVLCHLHGFGYSLLELCRMPDAICMVLGSPGWNYAGCPMPFAWFWVVLARIVRDVLCHLHGFG